MLQLMVEALGDIFQLRNLFLMLLGVIVGICVGILPGLGGTVGMSLVLPFIFGLRDDTTGAIMLLIGLAAVIHTADTFPSVLLGVPGSSGSQATIMDGYPMARQGQAARALSAAFFSSMFGGLIGATTLLMILPIARPVVLQFGPPEQFMLAMLGLSMVAVLGGRRPLRGLLAGALGLLIGAIRAAPNQPDVFRYDFDWPYLWGGIPLAVLALGLFALPEMLDLLASGKSIASADAKGSEKGLVLRGLRDVIANRFLVVRSAVVGVVIGFIPGLGGSVVDWISYGFARQTVRDSESFGHGDVRGVIAPESSNNAKEGGALIPTLLFGIPGSGTTAVLLSAFVLLGLTPGRDMLRESGDLNVTVLIIATLAVANVFGALACLSLSKVVAKLATVRAARLAPFVLLIMLVGAYQSTRNWGDFVAFMVIGLLGWVMRQLGFPLPPLLIGFVLSRGAEANMFRANSNRQIRDLSTYGWLGDPIVVGIAVVTILLALLGYRANKRTNEKTKAFQQELAERAGEDTSKATEELPNVKANLVFLVLLLGLFLYMAIEALGFAGKAAPFPRTVGFAAAGFALFELISYTGRVLAVRRDRALGADLPATSSDGATAEDDGGKVLQLGEESASFFRSFKGISRYLLWLFALYAGIYFIGIVVAGATFLALFLIIEGDLRWWKAIVAALLVLVFLVSMENIMSLRWPPSTFELLPEFIEDWFPEKIPLLNRLA